MRPIRDLFIPSLLIVLAGAGMVPQAIGADVTYRNDVRPLLKNLCGECHGDTSPTLAEFNLNNEYYKKEKLGPRLVSYEELLQFVVYPETGALMRRLDDGTNRADRAPGNMHKHLGETDAERASNFRMLKSWIGEDGWNLNRWKAADNLPAVTKEQMNKLQLKY